MDLTALSGLLRRRLLPLLLCIVAATSAAALTNQSTAPTYASSSSVIITLPNATGVNESLQGVQLTSQLLSSYAAVATSRAAAEKVRGRLALPESSDAVRRKIRVTPRPETLLLTVAALDNDPLRARSVADAATLVLIDEVTKLESNKRDKIVASVVDRASEAVQTGPRTKRNVALGVFLGLALGMGLALLLEALDRSLKTPGEAAALFGAPVLGLVPHLKPSAVSPSSTASEPLGVAGEAYRTLRTAVRFVNLDQPIRTLLVTSPSEGEGKTTTAANLAIAFAQSGDRVVLLDADLRRGGLVELLGLPDGVGVTSVVTNMASLNDSLLDWRSLLQVLGAGPLPPNPSEILGSQVMEGVLDSLRDYADIVVIDGAPVLPVTDSVVLSTLVDGVILVARSGRTHRAAAAEARRRLDGVGANVVGAVLNAVSGSATAGYYANYRYLQAPPQAASGLHRRVTDRLRR